MKKPRLLVLSGYIDPQKDSKISLCKIVIVYECVFFWVHDLREKLQHSISPALPSFISPSATYVFFCFFSWAVHPLVHQDLGKHVWTTEMMINFRKYIIIYYINIRSYEYIYGHLSVVSTYNPIYRMYNPIYNKL